jgi:hypothetical protein
LHVDGANDGAVRESADELDDLGLGVEGAAIGNGLGLLFELLHERVGDRHARKHLFAAVRARKRVAAETTEKRKVEVHRALKPVNGRSRFTSENLWKESE